MSTDITRGPKLCPSCGKENPPTAARCWLCFVPFGGASEPPPGAGYAVLPRTQPAGDFGSDCASAARAVGCAVLALISVPVTFFVVCSVGLGVHQTFFPPIAYDIAGIPIEFIPAGVAAVVVAFLIWCAHPRRRR